MKLPQPLEERPVTVILELRTPMPLTRLTRTSFWKSICDGHPKFEGLVRQAKAFVVLQAKRKTPRPARKKVAT